MLARIDVYETLHRYVREELLGGDDDDLDASTRLLEIGVLDSMTMVGLIAYIEKTFELRIPDTEIKKQHFATLETLTDLALSLRPA